ncbi:MAG: amidohydrolase family protein [Methanomicrobiaceae archaeon]|nr:amidohydrolase family protein [Methanomicrobiaceae archaeon]
MSDAVSFRGRALVGRELEERCVEITVEAGTVRAIEEVAPRNDCWILPCFFNAHTHIADTIAMDMPVTGSLAELVAPPDGLKHRLLRAASHDNLVRAMQSTVATMVQAGTAGFADFREGGVEGVHALRQALEGAPCRAVIFGREGGETVADGLGISSVREGAHVEAAVERARAQGLPVAIHAGEKDPHDIDAAIALEPDLIIHCTHADDRQLRRIAEMDIPIAVCPRSNWTLGVAAGADQPPLARMLARGCRVLLGTDNAMFVQPDMFREMAFTSLVYRISVKETLKMAVSGSDLFPAPFFIEEDCTANFFLIDPMRNNYHFSHDVCTTVVKRVNPCNIIRTILNPTTK